MFRAAIVQTLVILVLSVYCCDASPQQKHVCIHGRLNNQLTESVILSGDRGAVRHPVKRQTRQPMRFFPYYDQTVTDNSDENKRRMIQEVIPAVIKYFSSTLSVEPISGPLLLDRICANGQSFDPSPATGNDVRRCVTQCMRPPVCGTVTIPDAHLKRCVECNGAESQCQLGDPSENGVGVRDTDYILYISATPCGGGQTLAFAAACQIESQEERPIAGYINFCSDNLASTTRDFLFRVAQHEIFHALGFSSSLMTRWRDSAGNPRVPEGQRDQPLPSSIVNTIDYTEWNTISGPIQHTVSVLVTEAVVREGRDHFGCADLEGVELENQGGNGTALQHWEKRVLGNEAMTGIFDFNPTFSRLSLAVLEDSGWYTVDYATAQSLLWGRDRGCGFIRNGCGDMLDEEPFCGRNIGNDIFGCTLDRSSKASCNIDTLRDNVPSEYRYLPNSQGGRLEVADYCPYYREVTRVGGSTGNCTNTENQPDSSTSEAFFGETYGPNSVCFTQGRAWERTRGNIKTEVTQYGGGCYERVCSASDGLSIRVHGALFQCDCDGQELVVEVAVCDDVFEGSVICSSCSSVCGDTCPSPAQTCPGNVKNFQRVVVETRCDSDTTASSSLSLIPLFSLSLLLLLTLTLLL